jgi:hypothetical protein
MVNGEITMDVAIQAILQSITAAATGVTMTADVVAAKVSDSDISKHVQI